MRHRVWLSVALASLLAPPLLPARLAAQGQGGTELAKLRESVINQEEVLLRLKASRDALAFEKQQLDDHAARGKRRDITQAGARYQSLLGEIQERLRVAHGKRLTALHELLQGEDGEGGLQKKRAAALLAWRVARTADLKAVDDLVKKEKELGVGLGEHAAWPFWNAGLARVALWGGVLAFAGVVLALHEGRRGLRRRLRFHGRMGAAAVLALAVVGCDGMSATPPAGPDHLAAHRAELSGLLKTHDAEQKALAGEEKTLREGVKTARGNALAFWVGLIGQGPFQAGEEKTHEAVHNLLAAERTIAHAAAAHKQAQDSLRRQQDRLAGQLSLRFWHELAQSGALVGMCLGFVYLGFLPLRRARKRLRRQRAREAEQCPRCLGEGNLQLETSQVQDARYPEPKHLRCPECDYLFRASYRKLPRFCFPTVGVRGSGKTHWLVTAYDLIRNSNVPAPAVFKKAPSLADDEFDLLIESILKDHQGARPTAQNVLPYPLMFHVADADAFGSSAGLLNLFDFSGELMDQRIDEYTLRRRALLMDGFVLFLDPTQVHGKGKHAGIDYQNRVLTQFYEEMRDMRGQAVGARLNVPVAVCISKLDLLTLSNPLGSQAVSWLRSLRATTCDPVTPRVLRQRSRLCEQALPAMFPGWNIKKTLTENFGDRFLFFPMTPVGLEEAELGVTDLTNRTFAPFGVLEPILWLLHMHGYCMLA